MIAINISTNQIGLVGIDYSASFEVDKWKHRVTANLGFDTASFNLKAAKDVLEELFFSGLGRHVARYSPDGNFTVWEGQIVEMQLTVSGFSQRISLRDMANQVAVKYIPINTAANPPTESAETTTDFAGDTTSIARYGTKDLVFTPTKINKLTDTDAQQLRSTVLQQYKQPRRSGQLSSGTGDNLQVICDGYIHTLGWRTYTQTANSGTDNANTIISTVITAAGQFISSVQDLDTNTTQIQKYFGTEKRSTALEIIQAIAAMGDSGNKRWLAYIFENRILHYKEASSTIGYFRRSGDPRQEIFDAKDNRSVPYCEIRPNKWIRTTDIYQFNPPPATLQDDYTSIYIEAVEWSEPDDLSLTGSTGDGLQVVVARLANQGDMML